MFHEYILRPPIASQPLRLVKADENRKAEDGDQGVRKQNILEITIEEIRKQYQNEVLKQQDGYDDQDGVFAVHVGSPADEGKPEHQ
jgi:hypothetical protein